jgi:hypothetical protein
MVKTLRNILGVAIATPLAPLLFVYSFITRESTESLSYFAISIYGIAALVIVGLLWAVNIYLAGLAYGAWCYLVGRFLTKENILK